jgi:hypothetical protein
MESLTAQGDIDCITLAINFIETSGSFFSSWFKFLH